MTISNQAAEIHFQRFHLPKILQFYKIAPPPGERVFKCWSPWGQSCCLRSTASTHSNTEKGRMLLRKNVCANTDLCLRYTLLLKGQLENSMGMDGGYALVLLLHLSIAFGPSDSNCGGRFPIRSLQMVTMCHFLSALQKIAQLCTYNQICK